MQVAFLVFGAVLSSWLILSFLICIFWLINLEQREEFFGKHRRIAYTIAVGGFLSTFLFITEGTRSSMGFLPDAWGSFDEEGEFHAVRDTISLFIGCWAAIAIGYAYEKVTMLHRQQQVAESQLETQRRKSRLRDLSPSERSVVHEEYERRLSELDSILSVGDDLTRAERAEYDRLYELVHELETLKTRKSRRS